MHWEKQINGFAVFTLRNSLCYTFEESYVKKWLGGSAMSKISRLISGFICLCGVALFLYAISDYYVQLRDHCVDQSCEAFYDTPPSSEWLQAHGFNETWFAAAYAGLYGLFGIVYISVGLLIFRKKSSEFIGQLTSIALVTQAFTFNAISFGMQNIHPVLTFCLQLFNNISFGALFTLFFVFPNGRINPGWSRYVLALILTVGTLKGFFPGTAVDIEQIPPLFAAWTVFWMVSLIGIQIYRYRKVLDALERQQTKWAVFGMAVAVSGLLLISMIHIFQDELLQNNPLYLYFSDVVLLTCMMAIPVALLLALMRRRLWDIDPIVNRTLLYGSLSAFVIVIYIVVVWYIGLIFQSGPQWLASLIATGLVAVLFAPVKENMQRRLNRFMYGDNEDPLLVLSRLGEKLVDRLTPQDAWQVVVHTVKESLRLPYAGLSLVQDGEALLVAKEGIVQEQLVELPLIHRGDKIGNLLVCPRSPGESFSPSDHRFLEMLVRQAAAVVQSAKASIDLQRVAEDLRDSRERLVLAREEERRRLRRNLHDDLAPRLAALAFTASAAETLLQSDPAKTKEILIELQTVIRSSVADIRTLVHDLRPPALDELGLIGAVNERINDLCRPVNPPVAGSSLASPNGLQFFLHAPDRLPQLPAAVEVAAFRIITEAIVNVVKHSGATRCDVHLRVDGRIEIEVTDDGLGLREKTEWLGSGGIGLGSMRERAEELGGFCRIESLQPRGTRVLAYLPIIEANQGSVSA
ncbi:histidine kinase [Cohnella sp. AR92]|uniref:GAF domain-containing sensor histidine kinase n=1 Tax=Cohnella sp. AR92 TaxID=648716 RepID=UPI000F8D5259|nr:histidine kinase [Cohnella sp. AR92]RUS47350.1 sensor histidine kinase [Cohnella sp. AR92]